MNKINYLKHTLYTPDVYNRRFENDLPKEESMPKRIALAALPFIALYRPAGAFLSVGMGTCRIVTHIKGALSAEQEKAWKQMSKELLQTTLASLTLASTLFNFSIGTLVNTTVDTAQGTVTLLQHLHQGEYSKAAEEALHTFANGLYLSYMASGGLELMLAFSLVQALIAIVQARAEFAQGRYIEGGAKTIMASLRLHQANKYHQTIQRRKFLMSVAKYKALIERANNGRNVRHLIEHPLEGLEGNPVILKDADGNEVNFGAHFHGLGKQLVKGDNLTVRTKMVDGKEMIELDFKINHVFRDKIQKTIEELKSFNTKEANEILRLTHSHVEHIKIEKGEMGVVSRMWMDDLGEAHKINLAGLGSILIGSNPDSPNLYDRVVVHLPTTANIYDLHEMISFLDMDDALKISTFDDIERIKLGHLYRIFFPRDASPLERSEEFFTLGLEDLKRKMFEKTPDMKEIYESYFHRMKPYEILPGRVRYQVVGLSEKAHEAGVRALTAAITGTWEDKELFKRTASILKMGLISTETRFENEIDIHGYGGDYWSGGADSVFTQMFTEKNIKDQMEIDDLMYHSKVRLLIKREALEIGTYQYHSDNLGDRRWEEENDWWWRDSYKERPGIMEFIENEQQFNTDDHEIMLKERLDPSLIQALIVQDQETHDNLVQYLKSQNIHDMNGVAIDKFVRIGNTVTEELLA